MACPPSASCRGARCQLLFGVPNAPTTLLSTSRPLLFWCCCYCYWLLAVVVLGRLWCWRWCWWPTRQPPGHSTHWQATAMPHDAIMPWHNTTLGPICMIAQACLSFFPTLAHRAHASQRLGAGPPGLDWPKIVREADQAVQRHGGRPAGQHSIYPNILTVCGITVYFSIYPSILQ